MRRLLLCLVALLLPASGLLAQAEPPPLGLDPQASALPAKLQEVGFDQRMGASLPLAAEFVDSTGRAVRLGDYFVDRPVAVVMVYFDCPMLCPMTLEGVARSLKPLKLEVGEEFDMLIVSFDPREDHEMAAEARQRTIHRYGRTGTEDGWHFLTGEQDSIDALAEAIGFRYVFDDERQEFAHASGMVLVTPEGQVARYFFGIDQSPKDLRLGFVEASEGRVGSPVDQILLYCFQYDETIGRYTAVTMNIVRLGGLLTVVAIVTFIVVMLRREKKKNVTDLRTA